MSACVTLEEVLAAAHARCASLVPETSGYLALAVSDATSRLPLRLDHRAVLLTTEGTVTLRSRGEAVAPAEAARLLRDLLARLLASSAGSMPSLAATARPRPASEQDPDAVARELEAALIPVNRNAARRALARLARETLRAKEAGRLKRARAEVQARPAAQEASERAQPPPARSQHEPRAEAAVAPRGQAAVAPRDPAAAMRDEAAPPAPAIVALTLSPGPIAPAIVELTLSPGPVACETAGPPLQASAVAGEVAGTSAVEPSPEHAARSEAQTGAVEPPTHAGAQAEAFPEPTPTIVQAVVEIETAGAPAEVPVIPELIEPVRSIAPVALIASSSPIAPAVAAVAPEGTRAVAGSSPVACASGYGEALTSPEGIEVFLVDFSPAPARVAPPPREPTPTDSILVELSPDPAGVVPLSQEPTPTVATAVWAERMAAEGAAANHLAEAPAGATEVPAEAVEVPAEAGEVPAEAGEVPAEAGEVPAEAGEVPAEAVEVPAEAVETARAPAIHFKVEEAAALQVTPAYDGWPLVRREHLGAVPAGPRAPVASLEETPEARHTLPWPLPAQRGDGAPAAAAPPAAAETSAAVEADAPVSALDAVPADPPADAAPAEEPCPAGLAPIDAIVWSASRRSRSARPPADGAGASRVDELVARFVAQSEHSAQRRAARSMKALAGLDLTLTPPPVAALSASSALAIAGVRSPVPGAGRPVPSERAAPEAEPVALDEGSRPPAPLVTRRRRGLSLWLALVALALLFAGLAGTLRPELFASLAGPLARGALHVVPHAEARTPPPHD
ncbi:hypothetical protein WMF28_29160 [Sorangium sp. So ce590]|uniref:hypothetical protein n=1 Tax=Sorangium sp. So ce590 TaxID=3133317 RepID=UPI003F5E593D